MPPTPRQRLFPRSGSPEGHYVIVFAVLGSVIVIGGIVWGYFLPRWSNKHRRPVETRYNCIGGSRKHQSPLQHDLELPVIFPPHPAVVVPLNRKPKPEPVGRSRANYPSLIPVYDPRTQSPFPNTANAVPCRPSTSELSRPDKGALSASKPMSPRCSCMQRPIPHKSTTLARHALLNTCRTPTGYAKVGHAKDGAVENGRRSLLIARSPGAPPVKPSAVGSVSERSGHQPRSRKAAAMSSASTLLAVIAPDFQDPSKNDENHPLQNNVVPSAGWVGGSMRPKETLNANRRPTCTPYQTGPSSLNDFETPSSPETATPMRLGSSAHNVRHDSTPLTVPNSFVSQARRGDDSYPGITRLVPARRFKDYMATANLRRTPSTQIVSKPNPRLSSEEARGLSPIGSVDQRAVSGISLDASSE